MIIDCISDTHGEFPILEGGDLLIVAGDLTISNKEKEYDDFWRWCCYQNYKKTIVISGNHDNFLQDNPGFYDDHGPEFQYLCDSGTEFEGLKIWGSPWTPWFKGVHPHCKAFMKSESYIKKKFSRIPDDIDILVTHCPPWGILDYSNRSKWHCGSTSLMTELFNRKDIRCHVFGHIHEWGGQSVKIDDTQFVNASIMNEDYEAVNKPMRIDF